SGGGVSAVSSQKVGQDVVDYLNGQTGGGVVLSSVKREGDLYKVTVTYQGDTVPLYATLDGKNLVPQITPLDGAAQPGPTGGQPATPNSPVTIDADKIANAPVKGNANAPVTIVEFSDYQCPFCERAYQTLKQIDTEYIKTGKVKLVYMDFPLNFHEQAQKAAESVRCVRKQKGDEGYWKMHDKLFENQASLSEANFKQWARDVGANGAQFDACLDSDEFADEVQADAAYGAQLGVSGTPAFFINGVGLEGAQPFASFKQVIDAQLA
ncbi:MAG: thioredoxin domain-containing protein, partial [Nanoarchaeota archaeon]